MAGDLAPKIRKDVLEASKEQVAIKIVQNWKHLQLVMAGKGVKLANEPPTPEQLMGGPTHAGIAGDLIQKRSASFRLAGGTSQIISLSDVDEAVEEFAKKNPMARSIQQNLGKLADLVPKEDALNDIADATTRGINHQTGFGSKALSFIKGLGMYLFSLIKSIFTNEKALGFKEAMAAAAAPSVRDSVQGELRKLAANPDKPDAARLLYTQDGKGNTTFDTIGQMAFRGTYTELGATPPASAAPAAVTLRDAKPVDVDIGAFRTAITKQILFPEVDATGKPVPGKALADTIFEIMREGKKKAGLKGLLAFDSTLRKSSVTMADSIANTIADRITDPKFTYNGKKFSAMNEKEFADALADEVGKALIEKEAKGELSIPGSKLADKEKDGTENKNLVLIKDKVRQKAVEKYKELKPYLDVMGGNPTLADAASKAPLAPGAQELLGQAKPASEKDLFRLAPGASGPATSDRQIG